MRCAWWPATVASLPCSGCCGANRPPEAQLAVTLTAARAAFTQISLTFSDVFLTEATDVIAGFRPRPPGEPRPRKGGTSSVQLVAGFFVMQLDRAIAVFRTGGADESPCTRFASRVMGDLADDVVVAKTTRRGERGRVPRRPIA
jgi:hypothetical protein